MYTIEALYSFSNNNRIPGRTHNGLPFKIDFSLHIDGTHFEFKSFIVFIRRNEKTLGKANKFFFDSNHIIPMNFFRFHIGRL